MANKNLQSNPFTALLESMWARGEDGEVLARELAEALHHCILTGVGKKRYPVELKRLMELASTTGKKL